MSKQKKIRAWHFVRDDKRLGYDAEDLTVEPGYIYTTDSTPVLCQSGLHASRRVVDALKYAPGAYLCVVDVWGEVAEGDDKLVGTNRHVIAAADVTRELRLFACWCVRRQWHLLTDERSRRAIEEAEAHANGLASKDELAAARDAAWDAAMAAAWDAAWDAERKAQADELERIMREKFGLEAAHD